MILKTQKSLKNGESGFVLIAILLIIAVLAVIILEFNYESRMKLHLADNFNLAGKALDCADAGIAITIAALRKNENILSDEKFRSLFSGMVRIPIQKGYCTISIDEESAKFNINTLSTSDSQLMLNKVNQMLRLIDLLNAQYGESFPASYNLIPAIIDWVDSDNEVTILPFVKGENIGAENNYYQKLEDPYPCKNAPFDLLSEILLVKGMTMELFHGRPGNENKGMKPIVGFKQLLTVYGDGKININEASAMVIQSLSEMISYSLAQNIIQQRKLGLYENIEQLQQVPGMTPKIYEAIRELITVKSMDDYYIVTGTGVVDQFERKVQVVLRKDQQSTQVMTVMRYEM